jgi:hypothetical protein
MLVFKLSLYSVVLISGISYSLCAKRHSHVQKIERYEKRAQAAAQADSPLAAALGKKTKSMSYEEALLAQEYYRTNKQADMVILTGERILAVAVDQSRTGMQEVLRKTGLELAELYLEKGNYANAEKHAQDYLTFYPGSLESKKASFISLNAALRSQSHSQRDQEKTKITIEQATAYLEKYPQDTEFRSRVEEILHQSYLKLIKSELSIIGTILNTARNGHSPASLLSADKRIIELKEKLLPHAPEAKKRLLETELEIAHEQANNERIQTIQAELATVSPLSKASKNPTTWQSVKNYFNENVAAYFS